MPTNWREDTQRVLSRTIEGTKQTAPTRQQLRGTDRAAHAVRDRLARAKAREMHRIAVRSKRRNPPVAPPRKPAREWVTCKCGHTSSPWGFTNRHQCPAVPA